MGLTMVQRQVVTKTNATRYKRADKAGKGLMLDELCATTGWHRNHARKALALALKPRLVRPRAPRVPIYGPDVIAALAFCWAVLGAPTGKRLAPIMPELVPTLRRFDELVISDDTEIRERPITGAASNLPVVRIELATYVGLMNLSASRTAIGTPAARSDGSASMIVLVPNGMGL